jgi:hypothetical protein
MDSLLHRIEACSPPAGFRWLTESLGAIRAGGSAGLVLERFPAVRRHLGQSRVPDRPPTLLHGPEDPVSLQGWTADEAARVAFLLAVAGTDPGALPDLVRTAYHEGDSSEKKAVVQGLSLLPEPARFLDVALDAGRRAETTLFRAVACDNPFPARHYPELEFNKLVMKAAFVGAPLSRIVGLDRRANPDLARMGMDYVSEQESAVRRFDPQIWLAIAPYPPLGAVGRMVGYLSHSVAEQRLWAARGLRRAAQERTRAFLQERAAVEDDPAVLEAILEALDQPEGGPT